MSYKATVRNWMAAFGQSRMNLKQLRRLWRAWKHEGFSA